MPFFIIEKPDEKIMVCTIEPRRQIIKEYDIPEVDINTEFVLSNCDHQNYEDILAIGVRDGGGDQAADIEQNLRHFKLLNKSNFLINLKRYYIRD